MKLGVITVYNSLNCGAFFQAYALKSYIEKQGYEVYHLKNNARIQCFLLAKRIINDIIHFHFRPKDYLFFIKRIKKFRNNKNYFNEITKSSSIYPQISGFILGSDEIWNISRKSFRKYPVFWGGTIDGKKSSYATSINTTTLSELQQAKFPSRALKKLNYIAVRDLYSKQILERIINTEIEIVLDPTFLLDLDEYQNIKVSIPLTEEFIMVYSYGKIIKEDEIQQIRKFAATKNLKLFSVGMYHEWCDKNIAVTPFEFLEYINQAQYVITDTFHGSVFSVIYRKKFVSFCGNNMKVSELLKQLNLNERKVDKYSSIEDLLEKEIDYASLDKILTKERNNSKNYISKVLLNFEGDPFIDEKK